MPVDPATYIMAKSILDRCLRAGWDPVEELDRARVLLTPAQRKEISVLTLTLLLQRLATYRPVELLRRKYHAGHQASPADMYVVMMEFIEDWRSRVQEDE